MQAFYSGHGARFPKLAGEQNNILLLDVNRLRAVTPDRFLMPPIWQCRHTTHWTSVPWSGRAHHVIVSCAYVRSLFMGAFIIVQAASPGRANFRLPWKSRKVGNKSTRPTTSSFFRHPWHAGWQVTKIPLLPKGRRGETPRWHGRGQRTYRFAAGAAWWCATTARRRPDRHRAVR